jgi:hypothetical protein
MRRCLTGGMNERRRSRNTMDKPVTPGWRVEDSSRNRVKEIAAAAGVSPSQLIDALIMNVELNDRGVPTWWREVEKPEELPINPD